MARTTTFLRRTALFTLIFFSASHFSSIDVHAEPPAPISQPSFSGELSDITVPEKLGKIEEVYSGEGAPVILIQDAHAIPDAQKSIFQMLLHFEKKYGVRLIGLEGADGELDTKFFKSFPDKQKLKKVFRRYFNRGELTGGTAASLFSETPAVYRGLESWELYEKGLALYLAASEEAPRLNTALETWKQDLFARKQKSYPAPLLKADEAWQQFRRNQADLLTVLKTLASLKAPASGSELAFLLEEAGKSQASEAAEEAEVRKLAKKLQVQLNSSSRASNLEKEWNLREQEFSTSRIPAAAYAHYLKQLAHEKGLPFQMSSKLGGGIRAHEKMLQMEGTVFFQNLENYAAEVKSGYLISEEQKSLDRESARLERVRNLIALELSREDWQRMKEDGQGSFGLLEQGLRKQLGLSLEFYKNAEQREQVLLNGLLEFRKNFGDKKNESPAVMVAGGFHARGLTRLLKEQNCSYVLVMPRIAKMPETIRYREHMKGDVSWKRYFEVKNKKINLYEPFVRGTRDELLTSENSDLRKSWRDQIIQDLASAKEIERAGNYTKFLDETVSGSGDSVLQAALAKAERFLSELQKLDAEKNLNDQSIGNLLRTMTAADAVTASAAVPGASIRPFSELSASVRKTPRASRLSQKRASAAPSIAAVSTRAEARQSQLEAYVDTLLNQKRIAIPEGLTPVMIQRAVKDPKYSKYLLSELMNLLPPSEGPVFIGMASTLPDPKKEIFFYLISVYFHISPPAAWSSYKGIILEGMRDNSEHALLAGARIMEEVRESDSNFYHEIEAVLLTQLEAGSEEARWPAAVLYQSAQALDAETKRKIGNILISRTGTIEADYIADLNAEDTLHAVTQKAMQAADRGDNKAYFLMAHLLKTLLAGVSGHAFQPEVTYYPTPQLKAAHILYSYLWKSKNPLSAIGLYMVHASASAETMVEIESLIKDRILRGDAVAAAALPEMKRQGSQNKDTMLQIKAASIATAKRDDKKIKFLDQNSTHWTLIKFFAGAALISGLIFYMLLSGLYPVFAFSSLLFGIFSAVLSAVAVYGAMFYRNVLYGRAEKFDPVIKAHLKSLLEEGYLERLPEPMRQSFRKSLQKGKDLHYLVAAAIPYLPAEERGLLAHLILQGSGSAYHVPEYYKALALRYELFSPALQHKIAGQIILYAHSYIDFVDVLGYLMPFLRGYEKQNAEQILLSLISESDLKRSELLGIGLAFPHLSDEVKRNVIEIMQTNPIAKGEGVAGFAAGNSPAEIPLQAANEAVTAAHNGNTLLPEALGALLGNLSEQNERQKLDSWLRTVLSRYQNELPFLLIASRKLREFFRREVFGVQEGDLAPKLYREIMTQIMKGNASALFAYLLSTEKPDLLTVEDSDAEGADVEEVFDVEPPEEGDDLELGDLFEQFEQPFDVIGGGNPSAHLINFLGIPQNYDEEIGMVKRFYFEHKTPKSVVLEKIRAGESVRYDLGAFEQWSPLDKRDVVLELLNRQGPSDFEAMAVIGSYFMNHSPETGENVPLLVGEIFSHQLKTQIINYFMGGMEGGERGATQGFMTFLLLSGKDAFPGIMQLVGDPEWRPAAADTAWRSYFEGLRKFILEPQENNTLQLQSFVSSYIYTPGNVDSIAFYTLFYSPDFPAEMKTHLFNLVASYVNLERNGEMLGRFLRKAGLDSSLDEAVRDIYKDLLAELKEVAMTIPSMSEALAGLGQAYWRYTREERVEILRFLKTQAEAGNKAAVHALYLATQGFEEAGPGVLSSPNNELNALSNLLGVIVPHATTILESADLKNLYVKYALPFQEVMENLEEGLPIFRELDGFPEWNEAEKEALLDALLNTQDFAAMAIVAPHFIKMSIQEEPAIDETIAIDASFYQGLTEKIAKFFKRGIDAGNAEAKKGFADIFLELGSDYLPVVMGILEDGEAFQLSFFTQDHYAQMVINLMSPDSHMVEADVRYILSSGALTGNDMAALALAYSRSLPLDLKKQIIQALLDTDVNVNRNFFGEAAGRILKKADSDMTLTLNEAEMLSRLREKLRAHALTDESDSSIVGLGHAYWTYPPEKRQEIKEFFEDQAENGNTSAIHALYVASLDGVTAISMLGHQPQPQSQPESLLGPGIDFSDISSISSSSLTFDDILGASALQQPLMSSPSIPQFINMNATQEEADRIKTFYDQHKFSLEQILQKVEAGEPVHDDLDSWPSWSEGQKKSFVSRLIAYGQTYEHSFRALAVVGADYLQLATPQNKAAFFRHFLIGLTTVHEPDSVLKAAADLLEKLQPLERDEAMQKMGIHREGFPAIEAQSPGQTYFISKMNPSNAAILELLRSEPGIDILANVYSTGLPQEVKQDIFVRMSLLNAEGKIETSEELESLAVLIKKMAEDMLLPPEDVLKVKVMLDHIYQEFLEDEERSAVAVGHVFWFYPQQERWTIFSLLAHQGFQYEKKSYELHGIFLASQRSEKPVHAVLLRDEGVTPPASLSQALFLPPAVETYALQQTPPPISPASYPAASSSTQGTGFYEEEGQELDPESGQMVNTKYEFSIPRRQQVLSNPEAQRAAKGYKDFEALNVEVLRLWNVQNKTIADLNLLLKKMEEMVQLYLKLFKGGSDSEPVENAAQNPRLMGGGREMAEIFVSLKRKIEREKNHYHPGADIRAGIHPTIETLLRGYDEDRASSMIVTYSERYTAEQKQNVTFAELINIVHQKGRRNILDLITSYNVPKSKIVVKVSKTGVAGLSPQEIRLEIPYMDIRENPQGKPDFLLMTQLAKAFAKGQLAHKNYERSPLENIVVFLDDQGLTLSITLGVHSVRVLYTPKLIQEGGAILVDYQDSGGDYTIGSRNRVSIVAEVLRGMGLDVEARDYSLTASFDKDHRASSMEELPQKFYDVIQLLGAVKDLDLLIGQSPALQDLQSAETQLLKRHLIQHGFLPRWKVSPPSDATQAEVNRVLAQAARDLLRSLRSMNIPETFKRQIAGIALQAGVEATPVKGQRDVARIENQIRLQYQRGAGLLSPQNKQNYDRAAKESQTAFFLNQWEHADAGQIQSMRKMAGVVQAFKEMAEPRVLGAAGPYLIKRYALKLMEEQVTFYTLEDSDGNVLLASAVMGEFFFNQPRWDPVRRKSIPNNMLSYEDAAEILTMQHADQSADFTNWVKKFSPTYADWLQNHQGPRLMFRFFNETDFIGKAVPKADPQLLFSGARRELAISPVSLGATSVSQGQALARAVMNTPQKTEADLKDALLIAEHTAAADEEKIQASAGVFTNKGGVQSHAGNRAREHEKPALIGNSSEISGTVLKFKRFKGTEVRKTMVFQGREIAYYELSDYSEEEAEIKEGDIVYMDANRGILYWVAGGGDRAAQALFDRYQEWKKSPDAPEALVSIMANISNDNLLRAILDDLIHSSRLRGEGFDNFFELLIRQGRGSLVVDFLKNYSYQAIREYEAAAKGLPKKLYETERPEEVLAEVSRLHEMAERIWKIIRLANGHWEDAYTAEHLENSFKTKVLGPVRNWIKRYTDNLIETIQGLQDHPMNLLDLLRLNQQLTLVGVSFDAVSPGLAGLFNTLEMNRKREVENQKGRGILRKEDLKDRYSRPLGGGKSSNSAETAAGIEKLKAEGKLPSNVSFPQGFSIQPTEFSLWNDSGRPAEIDSQLKNVLGMNYGWLALKQIESLQALLIQDQRTDATAREVFSLFLTQTALAIKGGLESLNVDLIERVVLESKASLTRMLEMFQVSESFRSRIMVLGSVAVRSSGLQEDSEGDSGAGLRETKLNRTGLEEIAKAVIEVWTSGAEAVQIDEMINPNHKASGVAFGLDAVGKQFDKVRIISAKGTAKGLVDAEGGVADPDSHVFSNKKDESEKYPLAETPHIGKKETKLILNFDPNAPENQKIISVPLDADPVKAKVLQEAPALTDEQHQLVVATVLALSEFFGYAGDMEFSFDSDNRLVVLQFRPIPSMREVLDRGKNLVLTGTPTGEAGAPLFRAEHRELEAADAAFVNELAGAFLNVVPMASIVPGQVTGSIRLNGLQGFRIKLVDRIRERSEKRSELKSNDPQAVVRGQEMLVRALQWSHEVTGNLKGDVSILMNYPASYTKAVENAFDKLSIQGGTVYTVLPQALKRVKLKNVRALLMSREGKVPRIPDSQNRNWMPAAQSKIRPEEKVWAPGMQFKDLVGQGELRGIDPSYQTEIEAVIMGTLAVVMASEIREMNLLESPQVRADLLKTLFLEGKNKQALTFGKEIGVDFEQFGAFLTAKYKGSLKALQSA